MKKGSLLALTLLLVCAGASAQRRDAETAAGGQKMLVTGAVYDVNGSAIVYATSVVAESGGGKRYEGATDDEGVYKLELPLGVYKIRAGADGFCPRQVAGFRVVNSTHGKMSLDFVLEVADRQSECWRPGDHSEMTPKRKRKKPGIVIE